MNPTAGPTGVPGKGVEAVSAAKHSAKYLERARRRGGRHTPSKARGRNQDAAGSCEIPRNLRVWSVLWALVSFVSFGLGTPIVMGHAAHRLKSKSLVIASVSYFLGMAMAISIEPDNQRGVQDQVGIGIFAAVWLIGTLHAFALRPNVFAMDTHCRDLWSRQRALKLVRRAPLVARDLGIGRAYSPNAPIRDGGLIDLNHAGEGAIGRSLGIDAVTAHSVVTQRALVGGFSSSADLEFLLGLDPRLLDPVRGRLIFLPISDQQFARPGQRCSEIESHRADGRGHGPPLRAPSTPLIVGSWLWAFAPLLSGSILACPTLAYGAARLRSRTLWITCAGFLVAFVACTIIFDGASSSTLASDISAAAVGGAATAVALVVRKRVFEVDAVISARHQRKAELEIIAHDPSEAIRLQIGRADIPEDQRYPDGGLIDVNNVQPSVIGALLGTDLETTMQLVDIRREIWGFDSLADLCCTLDISPRCFDPLDGRLVFLPYLAFESEHYPVAS